MGQRCHVSLRFDGLNSTRCLEVSSSGVMSFEETHLISILLPAVVQYAIKLFTSPKVARWRKCYRDGRYSTSTFVPCHEAGLRGSTRPVDLV